ncbi:GCD complex subunit gcd7 [Coccidioides posadasii str. Silveira]|uniref:Translation initiation factor eIF2B subunit beta n=2 Tax=Coccidioides posadasii TaxID=199306 RepID=E9CRS1_COCPS|nr:translation regulator GCD7 [Coccidioides posadasii str. Silveira]QVM12155.1 GCD complex subunit gcd7 [Coccidioides posadasii str. Silveira]
MAAPAILPMTPSLSSYIQSLKQSSVEASTENLITLLKRRHIRQPHSCALATAHLLLRAMHTNKSNDPATLIDHVKRIGRRLVSAQPRQLIVGNIVRRVLGMMRDEAESWKRDCGMMSDAGSDDTRPHTPPHGGFHNLARLPTHPGGALEKLSHLDSLERPSFTGHVTAAPALPGTSMFNLLSYPPESTDPNSPVSVSRGEPDTSDDKPRDYRGEVFDGIKEILEELNQANDQIAAYALDHIHSNEVILTHTASTTVQKFLLKAAAKRKFSVIQVESYPNNHDDTHATVTGIRSGDEERLTPEAFQKPLIAQGITVILIPDSAVFALMSQVNKVILGTDCVLANGGLVAAAGTRLIANAAKAHKTPVVVVSGVYKLSPVYPFDQQSLVEYGDPSAVLPYEDGELVDNIDVVNPLSDYVPAELIDLYITNIGGHAPSYLYRIVADHYRNEDVKL